MYYMTFTKFTSTSFSSTMGVPASEVRSWVWVLPWWEFLMSQVTRGLPGSVLCHAFSRFLKISANTRSFMKYSHTLVLVSFRTHQTRYSSHFNEKKIFQYSVLAWDLLCVLEVVWVTRSPRKNKCFITCHLLGTRWFWHSSRVLELINDKYQGTTVFYENSFINF